MLLTRRSTARVLLLLATAAGLLCMHTLGHLRHSGAHPGAPVMVTATMVATDTVGVVTAEIGGTRVDSGHVPVMPLDPITICLAVLGAAALVAVTLLLRRRRPYGRAYHSSTPGGRWLSGRGPPTTLIGLRVADLSVMRN